MNTKLNFDDFEIEFIKPLGKGGFGGVFKGIEKSIGKAYAIKRISNYYYRDVEINNMLLLNECENSIKYYGFFIKENFTYLVLELCDCNLEQIIEKINLKEKEIKELLNKVFKIMHDNKIIHRDIKPENILIKRENNKNIYKLIDYGLSKQLSENYKASSEVGTLDYIAPEIKKKLNVPKSKVDLWRLEFLFTNYILGIRP